MSPGASPLLQLPYFDSKLVKAVEGEHSKTHITVQKYMQMPDQQRRKLTVGPGLLSASQYDTAISVARQIPTFEVSKAFLKVVGEKVITPSSLVQLVVKARFIPPGTVNVPEPSEADLEDPDPEEDDIDSLASKQKSGKKDKDSDENQVQPPLAHAPYFARDHSPRWHIFLADVKGDRVVVPPFTYTKFEKPLFHEDGKPTFNVQTMRMQFQAPPQVGKFPFVLHVVCDSYVGFDTSTDVTLEVEDLAKAGAVVNEDDISEPDEGMFPFFQVISF